MTRRKIIAAAVALCALAIVAVIGAMGASGSHTGARGAEMAYRPSLPTRLVKGHIADVLMHGREGNRGAKAGDSGRGPRSGRAGLRRPGVSVRGDRHRADARGVERRQEAQGPRLEARRRVAGARPVHERRGHARHADVQPADPVVGPRDRARRSTRTAANGAASTARSGSPPPAAASGGPTTRSKPSRTGTPVSDDIPSNAIGSLHRRPERRKRPHALRRHRRAERLERLRGRPRPLQVDRRRQPWRSSRAAGRRDQPLDRGDRGRPGQPEADLSAPTSPVTAPRRSTAAAYAADAPRSASTSRPTAAPRFHARAQPAQTPPNPASPTGATSSAAASRSRSTTRHTAARLRGRHRLRRSCARRRRRTLDADVPHGSARPSASAIRYEFAPRRWRRQDADLPRRAPNELTDPGRRTLRTPPRPRGCSDGRRDGTPA